MKISGQIVDVLNREIFSGTIEVQDGKIKNIQREKVTEKQYILPGFVDAHIHIESSMLPPSEFARLAVPFGTIATVSDPHEIANVLGIKGIEFMIQNSKTVPLKFYFGAPSCVPATNFESAGAIIDSNDIRNLLENPEIKYLSEMMNYPGVLFEDEEVLKKIQHAKDLNKPIDGHAPGLRGKEAKKYISAGISTDHECFTLDEALDKLKYGMKIIIREGSAAKNFEALFPLIDQFPDKIMLCSDDKHPDDLLLGHINQLVARSLEKGMNLMNILQAACVNPVLHYGLGVGLLQKGDSADFILTNDLKNFKIEQTFINGKLVAENGKALFKSSKARKINQFNCKKINPKDLKIPINQQKTEQKIRVIVAIDDQLITKEFHHKTKIKNGFLQADLENDILKFVVINRYQNAKPALAFIKNFNLKKGAIASTVAHDSHNIIAVGTSDEMISKAINLLIENHGGICYVDEEIAEILPLEIAGLMSCEAGEIVAKKYQALDQLTKKAGSKLKSPFMTLSFMALLVIPKLKLSDKGLFDGEKFSFVETEL